MKKFLFLKSSVLQKNSVSSELIDFAGQYVDEKEVIDLEKLNIPELNVENFIQFNQEDSQQRLFQKEQIQKIKEKDVIVIGAPMYNFSTSIQLKKYIDLIAKAGETFHYTESGSVGHLIANDVVIVSSRAGSYSEQGIDFFDQYMTTVWNFLGVKNVHFVYAEKLAFGEDIKNESIFQAKKQLIELINKIKN